MEPLTPLLASRRRAVTGANQLLARILAPLDAPLRRPWAVGAACSVTAAVLVVLRVAVAGHGHLGSLVLVGSRFAPGGHVSVPIVHGNGYDGQFYYRLALGPLDFSAQAHGIVMDSPQRFERVVYPVLAWALSLGHGSLVPWALVIVNVLALGALGWMGAVLAREGSRHPAWGLLLPAYFGFVWSLSRDLTEIVESVFIVAGLLALRRRRPWLAGVAWAAAALSRETALLVVGCVALVQLLTVLQRRRAPRRARGGPAPGGGQAGPADAASWAVPLVVFAAWQVVVRHEVGHLPLFASGQHNLAPLLLGVARGMAHYGALLPAKASILWFGELAVLTFVVGTAAWCLPTTGAPLHERLAWAGYGVLALCLAPGIWLGDVGFRSLDDVFVLSVVLLMASRRRLTVLAPVLGCTWLVVAIELIKVI